MKLHLLQQALTALRVPRQGEAERIARGRDSAPRTGSKTGESSNESRTLSQRIEQQVRSISPEDPQRRRRILRCTLEACLLSEWGDDMSNDPAFQALVDQVQSRVEHEPALKSIVDDALASLIPTDIK